MSKIALITDIHFGARNDSLIFDNYFRRFYDEVFFPYIDKHEIKTVVDLGDTFDRRKYINFNIANNCREYFFDPLRDRGISVHMIVGNHDTYFKNSNRVNSPALLLRDYENIVSYYGPSDAVIDDLSIAIVPWVCAENYKDTLEFIKTTKSQVMFGHLELAGFEMHRGQVSEHGTIDIQLLDGFDLVCSGHFHHKSRNRNIHYLGAPYEMTWSDYDDLRGFHIFDTETRELQFIQNPFFIFHKVIYNDTDATLESLLESIPEDYYKDGYIKLIVQQKNNPYWFDIFYDKLEKQLPASLQTIESTIGLDIESDEYLEECEDTQSLIKRSCEQVEVSADKKQLTKFMLSLHEEALLVE